MDVITAQVLERAICNTGNLSRIRTVFDKAEAGGPITIGFIGGSITMGSLSSRKETCYAYLVYEWWKKTFPAAVISYVNTGIGGTDSHFGAARAEIDLLVRKPDLVFVEFSVNDDSSEHYMRTYEGLLRRILSQDHSPAVVVVNSVRYDNGINAQEYHNRVAGYYELPVISMKNSLYQAVLSGILKKEEITPDNLHPNDLGHLLMAEVITGVLYRLWKSCGRIGNEGPYHIPEEPLTACGYEDAERFRNDNCDPVTAGFVPDGREQSGICDGFKKGWTGRKEGDAIIFYLTGGNLAVQYRKTIKKPAPSACAIVDDDERNAVVLDGNFNEDWGDCLYLQDVLADGERKEHKLEIRIVHTPEDCVSDFYLISVIASDR